VKCWQCPKCSERIWCLGSGVGHKCPNNRSNWVDWKLVPAEEAGEVPKPKIRRRTKAQIEADKKG
jgi:hypothetical protein